MFDENGEGEFELDDEDDGDLLVELTITFWVDCNPDVVVIVAFGVGTVLAGKLDVVLLKRNGDSNCADGEIILLKIVLV